MLSQIPGFLDDMVANIYVGIDADIWITDRSVCLQIYESEIWSQWYVKAPNAIHINHRNIQVVAW